MAQKTEKEETEFKVPETLTLCINNCGVTGNPATNNMCQNCFNATTTTTSSSSPAIASMKTPRSASIRSSPERSDRKPELKRDSSTQDLPEATEKKVANRCFGCRRKVGLTGFRCRCGELFCAEHRYTDRHNCSYDYKAAGREAIARENPVVKAAKIFRI